MPKNVLNSLVPRPAPSGAFFPARTRRRYHRLKKNKAKDFLGRKLKNTSVTVAEVSFFRACLALLNVFFGQLSVNLSDEFSGKNRWGPLKTFENIKAI